MVTTKNEVVAGSAPKISENDPLPFAKLSRLHFDYGALDNDLATGMQAAAKKIRGYMRAAVIDVGRELNEVKARVQHGCFVAWVEAECELPIRTAERAMLAAHVVDENDKLSYLPPDALVALGAKSAPKSVKAEILKEIEDGRRPIGAEIKQRLAAGRRPDSRAEARKPDPAAGILAMWPRLSLIDQEAVFRAMWNRFSATQQAAFRDWAFPGSPTCRVSEDAAALATEVSSSIGSAAYGKYTLSAETADSDAGPAPAEAGPSFVGPPDETEAIEELAPHEDGLVIHVPAAADLAPSVSAAAMNATSSSDTLRAAETAITAEELSRARLETEFAKLSAEQRVIDRDWVMRRLAQGDCPRGDQTSRFLQLYMAAQLAEQAAFRVRRVAEPVAKAA